MSRPFFRMLEPSEPWYADPADVAALERGFRGTYADISVCDATRCNPELALTAFYGWTTRPTPLRPSTLSFTEDEVVSDGGSLSKTDAAFSWPQEYHEAHHDVVRGQDLVAAAMTLRALREPERRAGFDRVALLGDIARQALRPDAPEDFRKKAIKRMSRILREEPEVWNAAVARFPHVRELTPPGR